MPVLVNAPLSTGYRIGPAMRCEVFQVDAFADHTFGGNPAGVVADAHGLSEVSMRRLAREMNASETAFVLPADAPGADLRVRFFTPQVEVPLCGHATIATFHVLSEIGRLAPSPDGYIRVNQQTGAGVLAVEVGRDAEGRIVVVMAQARPDFRPGIDPAKAAWLLDLPFGRIDASLPNERAYTGLWTLAIAVHEPADLRLVSPRLADIAKEAPDVEGLYVYAVTRRGAEAEAQARFFGTPRIGIIEDPVTGTAAGSLGALLARHGVLGPTGTGWLRIRQGVEMDRPGEVRVEVTLGPDGHRVKVAGRAITVFRTEIDFNDNT